MLVDAHCHLESFKKKQLGELPAHILPVTSGYSHKSNAENVEIAERLGVPFCLGIAPQTVIREGLGKMDGWEGFIREANPNAIGEIGLDFHWGKTEKHFADEKEAFGRMLGLAEGMGLPVVLHTRRAESAVLDFIEEWGWKKPFMMHFFSGKAEEGVRAVEMGGIISIPPLHSKERRKAIEAVPLGKLVAETDAPYVVRGIEGVEKSIEYIAEVKGISAEKAGRATAENALRFFNVRK